MAFDYYTKTVGNRQAKRMTWQSGYKMNPFNRANLKPLDYSATFERSIASNMPNQTGVGYWGAIFPVHADPRPASYNTPQFNSVGNSAYARAYQKFKDKVYTQASNLTAIRERAKTIDMVLARLRQVQKGLTSLRKGRFLDFLNTFGIDPLRQHRKKKWAKPKEWSGLWLEYWMGWAPTLGDIYTSLEFLGEELPTDIVRAGARVPYVRYYEQSQVSGGVKTTSLSSYDGTVTVWIKAQVVLTNPSLFNLQGLGLLNPAKTIWETIPFSWFADWFTNVGQVLGQVTDWVGLQLKNLEIACKTACSCSWHCWNADKLNPTYPKNAVLDYEFEAFSRRTGATLPTVKPIVKLPNGLSITRGLTLSSLIVQLFSPKGFKPA